jgi:Core-2/I-Branching enzyme
VLVHQEPGLSEPAADINNALRPKLCKSGTITHACPINDEAIRTGKRRAASILARIALDSLLLVRIGYVMSTYKNAEQIAALAAELLRSGDTSAVAIHHDAKSGVLSRFTDDPRVRIMPNPRAVRWAHWTQVQAIVETTQRMLAEHPTIDWIVLLTGQDWPVVPVEEIGPALAATNVDACIDAVDSKRAWGWEAGRRYLNRWYQLPPWCARAAPMLERVNFLPGITYLKFYGAARVDLLGIRSRTLRDRRLVGGMEYFMMNRAAWSAVEHAYGDPAEQRAFSRSLVPTEVFFATTVADRGLRIGPPRRYARFVVGRANPEPLQAADAAAAQSQYCLFARKLEPATAREFIAALDRAAPAAT